MLKLISENSYNCSGLVITVTGLNCDQLSRIHPICSAMDRKVKQRMLEIAHDEEIATLIGKRDSEDELTREEAIKLGVFFQQHSEEFTMAELVELAESYMDNITKVTQGEEDVTVEFKDLVLSSPKFLKALGSIIQEEYKEATEVADTKKL